MGSIDSGGYLCYIFKPSVSCLAGARATGREDGIAPRGGDFGGYFLLPPKLDSVKKNGKTYIKMDGFGKDPLFSRNIHIHYVFVVYFGCICFASEFVVSMIYTSY